MPKIVKISSDEGVKYITFKLEEGFIETFQSFLKDIGISRNRRKNLFKSPNVITRGGSDLEGFRDSLQVINDKERTLSIEIFAGESIAIAIIHCKDKEQEIGEALEKHFEFS